MIRISWSYSINLSVDSFTCSQVIVIFLPKQNLGGWFIKKASLCSIEHKFHSCLRLVLTNKDASGLQGGKRLLCCHHSKGFLLRKPACVKNNVKHISKQAGWDCWYSLPLVSSFFHSFWASLLVVHSFFLQFHKKSIIFTTGSLSFQKNLKVKGMRLWKRPAKQQSTIRTLNKKFPIQKYYHLWKGTKHSSRFSQVERKAKAVKFLLALRS